MEGFASGGTTRRTVARVYDKLYCNLYKSMIADYKRVLVEFEAKDLVQAWRELSSKKTNGNGNGNSVTQERPADAKKQDPPMRVADLGCGPGTHAAVLRSAHGSIVTALDQSEDMLRLATEANNNDKSRRERRSSLLPRLRAVQGDFQDPSVLPDNSFDVCTMYYFSYYFSTDRAALCRNVHSWLIPGGLWAVHLVEPARFDPIIDAATPFVGFSIGKYLSGTQKNTSTVHFADFVYRGTFQYRGPREKHIASFTETLTYKDPARARKKNRTHQIDLVMKPLRETMAEITDSGLFSFLKLTSLAAVGYEHQCIAYFRRRTKPRRAKKNNASHN